MARRPRDYRAHGSAYDALVLGLVGHYLALLEASMLVEGEEIDAERAVLEAILADRKAGIHRPVTWRSIDRDVCTCALVLPDDQAFVETTGHIDPVTFQLEGTILVEHEGRREGVCLHCTATYRDDSFDQLRQWQRVHVCPPDEPEPEVKVDPVDFRFHRTQAHYFRSIIGDRQRRMHPRSGSVGPEAEEGA
ncbi:hypothetical protein ncot_16060 [Nocardioides sp. JQ2195]|uniref:hypothetical protein n=1 Tax=Nocardioides sp. JQ2195 TaxID=2592334 RepID=UPI00143E42E5|nr:hypothetical protein [Nocardioides sp. JQ2195]QIX27932.1 hypothetical protein ncot_16060 [Nocardioides sp. JQ2195]